MKPDILEYLWRRFPTHCIALTDPVMLRAIGFGMARAAVHGFTTAEQVASWLVLMIYLGSRFDEDPLHFWAAETLGRTQTLPRDEALRILFSELNRNMNPALGEKSIHYREALSRVGRLRFDLILAGNDANLEETLPKWMQTAWPQRYETLSKETRNFLVARSRECAVRYGLLPGSGAIECLLAMLMFGSHIDRDPLLPWAEAVLTDRDIADPLPRTRLAHETMRSVMVRFARLRRLYSGEDIHGLLF